MAAMKLAARAQARLRASMLRHAGQELFVRYVSFWARFVLRMRRPLIVGVTGSAGKTTAVHMIAAVLSHPAARDTVGAVAHTSHNMNDDVGLPLTVLRYDRWIGWGQVWKAAPLVPARALWHAFLAPYPRVLVLEYGAHARGHLHRLTELAPPAIGVVTTIGPAHLDRLKTLEGVVREKSAVVRAVPASGLVVLGTGHDHVGALEAQARGRIVKLEGRGVDLARGIARAVARSLAVPESAIDAALADFRPVHGRLNEQQVRGMTVIDDSVNANPLSMRLGLDALAAGARPGQRRVACLGAMGELGDEAVRYHGEIGACAREKADVVIGVGELARHYRPDHWFADSTECARQVRNLVAAGDRVLVKGSASVRMKDVVEALRGAAMRGPSTQGSVRDRPGGR